MDVETRDTAEPSQRKRPRLWLWLAIAAAAAVLAAVAYSQNSSTTATATSDSIPNIVDLANAAPSQEGPAPDFSVPTLDGTTFSLSEHLAEDGRPVFLNLWASWCFPCRAEMPAIDAAAQENPDVLFVGVSVKDPRDEAEKFAREIAVGYTLAFDEEDQVADKYPVLGMPATFLISSDGTVVRTIYGGLDEASISQFLSEAFGL